MIVFCEECGTRYSVDLNNIKGRWHSFHCRECDFLITISQERPTDIISPDVALKNQLGTGETSDPRRKKRVLVVDDSKLFRRIIKQILESDGTIEVVGEAADGNEALQRNLELKPDLITLDINMPRMGGTSVLKRFMLTHPCPVVIVSNLSNRSQDTIIDFLRLGAVDFLVKPTREQDPDEVRKKFIKTVHDAAGARVKEFTRLSAPQVISTTQSKPSVPGIPCRQLAIIVSGAGGMAELFNIFTTLPGGFEGAVIVIQTMPEELIPPLVAYLNQICRIPVLPLARETRIIAGQSYIGTSDTVMELHEQQAGLYLTTLDEPPPPHADRQGIDTLLRSVADSFTGIFSLTLLSGTKACSVETLRYFKTKSGKIIVKQPSTCMMRDYLEEIGEAGLADTEAAPENIVETIIEHLHLQCMALPAGDLKTIAPEFSQKRHHQRIHFPLQTGPRLTLGVAGSSGEKTILQAGIMDLSAAGIGFVVAQDDHATMVLGTGQKITILSVEGEPQLRFLEEATAEICWVMDPPQSPFFRYGGMFLDIAEPLRQHLRHIVETALQAHQSALVD